MRTHVPRTRNPLVATDTDPIVNDSDYKVGCVLTLRFSESARRRGLMFFDAQLISALQRVDQEHPWHHIKSREEIRRIIVPYSISGGRVSFCRWNVSRPNRRISIWSLRTLKDSEIHAFRMYLTTLATELMRRSPGVFEEITVSFLPRQFSRITPPAVPAHLPRNTTVSFGL